MGTIAATGDLDLATVDVLEAEVDEAARRGDDPIVLDLSRLDFMDSSGAHLLVRLRERYGPERLQVRGPVGRVRKVLAMLDLSSLLGPPIVGG